MKKTFESKVRLDPVDWSLLEALQRTGRLTYAQLGRQVGLTAPAVAERVRNLETEGVIEGYRADVNAGLLNYGITAIIRLAVPTGTQCTTLLSSLSKHREVLEAFRVTGEDSAVIKAVVSSSDHLQDLIDRLTALGKPTTSIATSAFKRVPAIERTSAHGKRQAVRKRHV